MAKGSYIFDKTPCTDTKEKTPFIDLDENIAEQSAVSPQQAPKTVKENQVKDESKTVKPNHGTVQTAEKKPEKKVMSEQEIYKLKKDEQVSLLKKLGATEIPHYEKDRVDLIFKLQ